MDLTQFFVTFAIAFTLGGMVLYFYQDFLRISRHWYRKLTFRHKILVPYTPTTKSDR